MDEQQSVEAVAELESEDLVDDEAVLGDARKHLDPICPP
jgi:hypothetical protein